MDIIQRIQQLILRMIPTRKLYPVSSLRFSWLFAKLIMRSVIIISLSLCYYSFPLVTILCIRAPNHQRAAADCPLNDRLDRGLLDIVQHVKHDFAAALDQAEDRGLLFLQGAAATLAFQPAPPPLPAFF